jgi:phytoene desaturase
MLYLGLDTLYEAEHHTIVFARDYEKNLDEIAHKKVLSEDISFYVRNASVTDPHIAPAGHSSVYVLVPVPNNQSNIDWEKEAVPFRERVLEAIESRTRMTDLRSHIVAEEMIHPGQWEDERDIYAGATFNLAHSLGQMLYLRPRNRFEEWDHCYLVGGGTHPGSGLPTIYESGRISADMISKRYGVPVDPLVPLPE